MIDTGQVISDCEQMYVDASSIPLPMDPCPLAVATEDEEPVYNVESLPVLPDFMQTVECTIDTEDDEVDIDDDDIRTKAASIVSSIG